MKNFKFFIFFIFIITSAYAGLKSDSLHNILIIEGKKHWISQSQYFTFSFVNKPKIGTEILKIQVFKVTEKQVQQDKSFEIKCFYFMPSMKMDHQTTENFKISNKGFYLLPINFVMTGNWEIQLEFSKSKNIEYRGKFNIKI